MLALVIDVVEILKTPVSESPSWMDVEPSGIMISPPRATTATRIPGFRDRSRRGVPRWRVEAVTVNSMASAAPSAMRYRAFITLPWEFCIPRTTWRMWEVASCLGEMMLSRPTAWAIRL